MNGTLKTSKKYLHLFCHKLLWQYWLEITLHRSCFHQQLLSKANIRADCRGPEAMMKTTNNHQEQKPTKHWRQSQHWRHGQIWSLASAHLRVIDSNSKRHFQKLSNAPKYTSLKIQKSSIINKRTTKTYNNVLINVLTFTSYAICNRKNRTHSTQTRMTHAADP